MADDVGQLLLDTVNGILERRVSVSRDVDTKLGALLGFVAGGAGVIAIVTAGRGGAPPPVTPLLISALVSLLITLIACLEGTFNRPRRGIEIDLIKATQLEDGSLRPKDQLTARFVASLFSLSKSHNQANGLKRRLLFTANSSFVLAIVAITLNALWFKA